jgi:hypothetical protein
MNVILTACTGYASKQVLHFLKSYSCYVTDANLVVFGGNIGSDTINSINETGATFIDVTGKFRDVSETAIKLVSRFRGRSEKLFFLTYKLASLAESSKFGSSNGLQFAFTGIQALRYLVYSDYLESEPNVSNIFLTDIRDVIFQTDIFKTPVCSLELYEEEQKSIGDCPYNYGWVQHLLGKAHARKYKNFNVLCSGTTTGNVHAMKEYLRLMSECVDNSSLPLGAIDQGIHNFLYYSGKLQQASPIVFTNRTGRVQTLGYQPNYTISDRLLRNLDGAIVPVVHQWDRHAELQSWADEHCHIIHK